MANGKITFGKQSGGTLGLVFPDGVTNTEVVLPESGTLASVDTAVTDNSIARYDGTTGKLQDSGVIIDDNGNVGLGVTPRSRLDMGGASPRNSISWHSNSTISYSNIWDSYNGSALTLGNGLKGSNTVVNGYESSVSTACGKSALELYNGNINFYTNPSDLVAYGTPYTPTKVVAISNNGNLLLTSGTGALGYGAGAGGSVTQLTSKSTNVTLNKPSGRIIMNNEALAAGVAVYFNLYNSIVGANDTIIINMDRTTGDLGKYKIEYNVISGIVLIKLTNQAYDSYSDALVLKFTVIKGANA